MMNNKLSLSQYSVSFFLSSLSGLLFINSGINILEITFSLIAVCFNMLVIYFYNGKINKISRVILYGYLFVVSTLIMNKFIIFMNKDIKSGPYYILIAIMAVTIYFSYRKGMEALTRSGLIIVFFTTFFLIYIFVSTCTRISFNEIKISNNFSLPFVLLLPSAIYFLSCEKIIEKKKYPVIIYGVSTILVMFYSLLLTLNKTLFSATRSGRIGIFKGSEFLLLILITIGVIFSVSLSVLSFENHKAKHSQKILYFAIFIATSICLYFNS